MRTVIHKKLSEKINETSHQNEEEEEIVSSSARSNSLPQQNDDFFWLQMRKENEKREGDGEKKERAWVSLFLLLRRSIKQSTSTVVRLYFSFSLSLSLFPTHWWQTRPSSHRHPWPRPNCLLIGALHCSTSTFSFDMIRTHHIRFAFLFNTSMHFICQRHFLPLKHFFLKSKNFFVFFNVKISILFSFSSTSIGSLGNHWRDVCEAIGSDPWEIKTKFWFFRWNFSWIKGYTLSACDLLDPSLKIEWLSH